MLKRPTAFALLAGILLSLFTACGDGKTPPPSTSGNDPSDTSASDSSTTGIYDTIKHDVYYNDMDFNVLLTGNSIHTPDDFTIQQTGTVMSEAVFQKNSIMADKYGVIIKAMTDFGSSNQGETLMRRANTAGENDYQLCILSGYTCSSLATEGILYDLSEMPNIDLTNTWWDQTAVRDLSIAKSVFFITGSLSTAIDDFTFCVLFNKEIFRSKINDGTDLYQLAREGKWTLDVFQRLCSLVSEDLNADDVMDDQDAYGVILWDDELLGQMKAGGEKIATVNEEGLIELTLYSERSDAIVNQFVNLANSEYAYNFQHRAGGSDWAKMFNNDQALFLMTMFNECYRFRNMDTYYGILPQPRFTEDQEWYSPFAVWHSAFICVPSVCTDTESVGIITELLGYHSEEKLIPACYDKTLNGTYIRDDESSDMLDIIFHNRIYDIGHLYRIASLQESITNLLRNNKPTVLSGLYQSTKRASETIITNLNKSIEKLKSDYQ